MRLRINKMKKKIIVVKNDGKEIKYTYSFILPWLLSNINVEITEGSSQLLQFSYGVLLGSLTALFCMFSIIGYLIVNYLLVKVEEDFERKYPKIWKYIIIRFKNVGLMFICIDIIICLVIFIFICFLFICYCYTNFLFIIKYSLFCSI
jgi:hypothetical protein